MKYSKDYEIHYYHCNADMQCSIHSMIRIFEDIAIQQSESLGVGVEYYNREKVGWMLSRWLVNINRLPQYGESIKIVTTPKALSGFYANREFSVLDSTGEEIVSANTLWIFVNLETRRPMRITQHMYDAYGPSREEMKTFTKLNEVRLIEDVQYKKQFRVRLSDIDTNGHVNNSHYISWALETLSPELLKKTIVSLNVNYLKETSYDDIIQSETQIFEQEELTKCIHNIKLNDISVCRIQSCWK